LSLTSGVGGVTTRKLLERFGDVESIYETSPEEIAAVPSISISISQQLLNSPIEQLEVEQLSLNGEGNDFRTRDDDRFTSNQLCSLCTIITLCSREIVSGFSTQSGNRVPMNNFLALRVYIGLERFLSCLLR